MTSPIVLDHHDGAGPAPARPLRGSLAARLAVGDDGVLLTFAGQGWRWWEAMVELLEHRDDLRPVAEEWARVVDGALGGADALAAGGVSVAFDPLGWIDRRRRRPDAGVLLSPALSIPGCLFTQLLTYRALWEDGLAAAVDAGALRGALGHSAGVLAAAAVAEQPWGLPDHGRVAVHLELAVAVGVGIAGDPEAVSARALAAANDGDPDAPVPMAAVSGVRLDRLQDALDEVGTDVTVALRHGPARAVLCGPVDALAALRPALERHLGARPGTAGRRAVWEPLPVGYPGHHPSAAALAADLADAARGAGRALHAERFAVPVVSAAEARPHHGDCTGAVLADLLSRPAAWDRTLWSTVHDGAGGSPATWVLDVGPGDGVARLSAAALRGGRARVLAAGTPAGRRQVVAVGAAPAGPRPFDASMPTVVELPDGSRRLENRFTRLTGRSPVVLAGMTPTTVDAPIVAAAANAGFVAELAGGGQVNARVLDLRLEELGELLDPGQEVVFNTLHLDPYLWNLHLGRERLVQQARRAGAPICGVTVSAGVPEVDDAVALLDELAGLGMWCNAFKPGTVEQIDRVVAIASAAPHHTILVHVEGGVAGGHHSWEGLEDLLLLTYHRLRSAPNLVICAGGGVGTPDRATELLTGTWALRHGPAPMPVDAVLVGTAAMACAEATATPGVKEALRAAAGAEGFVGRGQVRGGVTSGRSGLDADIHFLDNAASRGAALLDEVAGDADAVAERRDEIVAALAVTAKPYFGDVVDMTYRELLDRFVELVAVGRDGRYEDGAWLDVTHRSRFLELLQRAEARLHPAEEGRVPTGFADPASVDDPRAAVADLVARHPDASVTPLHPADVPFFLEVCRRPGKPVPFVPVIDADVRRWYQSDALWQAQHPAYDADAVLIIPGPSAVAGITAVDRPVAELLGDFEADAVRALTGRGVRPRPVPRLRRGGPTAAFSGPVAVLGESPTVVHRGRSVPNPLLAVAPAESWVCTPDDGGRLQRSGVVLDGVDGRREQVLVRADGEDVVATLRFPSSRRPGGDQELELRFTHVHRAGVEVIQVDDDAWRDALDRLLRTTLLDGVGEPVAVGQDAVVRVDAPQPSAHAVAVGAAPRTRLPDAWLAAAWPAVFRVLGAPELVDGLLDLVHLVHEVEVTGAADPTGAVDVRARVVAVEDQAGGCRVDTLAEVRPGGTDGEPAVRLRSSFLIRGRRADELGGPRPGATEEAGPGPVVARPRRTLVRERTRAPECMDGFAVASGDHNPIHTSVVMARLAGLDAPIVHGAWTSAAAQRVLLEGLGVRPERLRSWRARFLAPVTPGEELEITAVRTGMRAGAEVLEVTVVALRPPAGGSDGAAADPERVPVLSAGAELAPPRTAYLFPGQGVQQPGMGMDGYERSAAARRVWDRADAHTRERLGFSILHVVRDNPTELSTPGEVFRHPAGVLHLTQFTQVAMATLASAQVAELRETGAFVEDAVTAGHSVGEYNALAAVAGVLPLEAVVELVFQRGLAMHHLVPRDELGASRYRLGVVRPHEVGLDHAGLEELVARLRDGDEPLEIVNFNLRGKQYAVAGTVGSLGRLEEELVGRAGPGARPPFLLVPGIDVPFHSGVLRDGVAEFRHHLEAQLPEEVDPALLVGRYVPNLVPRPFTLDRDLVAEVRDLTGTDRLGPVAEDGADGDRDDGEARPGRRCRRLLVELLAWQFASPVRWIETQDLLFTPVEDGGLGVERVIEVGLGSAPTVANLARGTLALPDHRGLRPEVLNVEAERDAVFRTDEDPEPAPQEPSVDGGPPRPPAADEAAPPAPPVPSEAPPAGRVVDDPAAGGSVAGDSVPDRPMAVGDALEALLCLQLRLRPDQLRPEESLDDLVDGVSSRRNQLLMDLGAEFGVSGVDGAQQLPLPRLAEELAGRAGRYRAPGPVLAAARDQLVAGVLGPLGARPRQVTERVSGHWGLGEGWAERVLLTLAVEGRDGDSARGGPLGSLHPLPAGVDALVDAAVGHAASAAGVALTPPRADAEGGTVDAAAVRDLEARLAGPDGLLASVARDLLERTGAVTSPGDGVDDPSGGEAARLAALDAEHGHDRADRVAPRFDARAHVVFSSWWATARHDLVRLHHEGLRGERSPEELDAEAARLAGCAGDPGVAAVAAWFAARAADRGDRRAAARFERVLAGGAPPLQLPSVRPSVRADRSGALLVEDVTDPGDRPGELLDALAGGDEVHRRLAEVLAGTRRATPDLSGEVALVTGASPGGIAFELVRRLLAGGATVICTTTNPTPERLAAYRELYGGVAAPGAELHVVPANLASFSDVDALVEWLVSPVAEGPGRPGKPPLRPTLLVPFAAGPVAGDLPDAGPRAEVAMRTLLWGVERLIGRVAGALEDLGAGGGRCHVLLPASPNHGAFGGDGAYGEAKAALEAVAERWVAERERWGATVSLAVATIGWVRGTGLMDANDALAALVERDLGVRTYSTAEMAWMLEGLVLPELRAAAAEAPVRVRLDGGLLGRELARDTEPLRRELAELARSGEPAAPADGSGSEEPDDRSTLPALPSPVRPAPLCAADDLPPAPRLGLDDLVVVVGAGEVGPWGGSATRFDLEVDGELSPASVVELAWVCGLVRWESDGPAAGWVDVASGDAVPEEEVAARYRDEVHDRCGIRRFDPDGPLDPDGVPLLAEVFLDRDLTIPVASEAEARALAATDPERSVVAPRPDGDGWHVVRRAGSRIRVPRLARLSRRVGAQLPRGFDPTAWGIPPEMAASVDRVALWNLVATVEAFLDAGLRPEELLARVHPARVANTQGTGMGGMTSIRGMYVDSLLGVERPNDLLQEALANVVAAYVVQSYVGGYGAAVQPVSACATAAVSLEVGADLIRLGKADVVVTGGWDDLGVEGVVGFGAMSATASSDDLEAAGLAPHQFSRANDRRRAGFVEGQGGGTIVVARGSVAADLGLPVRGVVVYAASFSDGIQTSIPAPGLGALACVLGGTDSPLARALADHGLVPDDVAVVSKHDTSTAANDPNESELHQRIARALGRSPGNPMLTVSQKTVTGHAKGGAAAWQAIGLLQVLETGQVPGNRNLECLADSHRDHTSLVYGHRTVLAGEPLRAGLLTSLGFGHVSAVVCLAGPGTFLAALEAAGDPGRDPDAYRRAATRRRLQGRRAALAARHGGDPPYAKRTDRRLGGEDAAARHDAEVALLTDPGARLGDAGVYGPTGPVAR